MSESLWTAVIVAGVVALITPIGLRPLLCRLKAFDVPCDRSSHSQPTLRGGGLAALVGFTTGVILAIIALPRDSVTLVVLVGLAAIAISIVGFVEDVRGVRASVRAGLQFLFGAALAFGLSLMTGTSLIWLPLAILFFAANVNFVNFMDGINGISGMNGTVAGLAYAALGAVEALPWLTVLGLITAVVFAAFLPWNLTPPGMFLGDVGSYLLGGALGAIAITALLSGLNPIGALAPLAICWADTVATLVRRAGRGEPLLSPHRSHAYQRLTNTGMSHVSVALFVSLCTMATSAIGFLSASARLATPLGLGLIVGVIAVYLALPRLRGDAQPPSVNAPLAPAPSVRPATARGGFSPKRWAILGSTGFIGSAIVTDLTEAGIEVTGIAAPRLTLDPRSTDGQAVMAMAAAASETHELAQQLAGFDVVINAAGLAAPDVGATNELYGANALLPAVIARACIRVGVPRVLHLSSAAVQGSRRVLDTSTDVEPFSPYSRSKALGERALLAISEHTRGPSGTDVIIIRATSVQGPGRRTTETLKRVARSPLASVAAPGNYPSAVSSVTGLVQFIRQTAASTEAIPRIVLQPSEGLTVAEVMEIAGGKPPQQLPVWVCTTALAIGGVLGRVFPELAGLVRRVEMMWLGQAQVSDYPMQAPLPSSSHVRKDLASMETLSGDGD